jgi:hypothetical protein
MAGRVVACDRRIGTGLQRRAWPLGASRDLLAVRSPKEQEGEPVATASIGHRRRRGIEGASGALRGVQRRGGTEVEDQGPRVGVAGESFPGQSDRRRRGRGLGSLLRRLAAIGSASYSGAETGKLSDATGSDFKPVAGSARAGLLQRSPQAAPRQRLPIANAGKASLGMPLAISLGLPTPGPVDVVEVIPTLRGFRPPGGNQVPQPPRR